MVLQGEHLSIGFTAAQVQQLVQADRAGLVQQYTSQLIELSKQLGATREAVRTMLQIAGQDDIPIERWPDTLVAIATQFRAMRQALDRPDNDDSETAELRRRAVSALDSGAFDEATRLLNDIRARERAASEQRRRRAAEAHADWLAGLQSEAETCALLARAALAQRDVAGAYGQFEEGLRVLTPADPTSRLSYALDAAAALAEFGDRAGRNDALVTAIDLYRRALADAPRDRVPLQWAMTQNNLGIALLRLGERESETGRLEEAVAEYRVAIALNPKDPYPHNGLGNVLHGQGKAEEAIAEYRAAIALDPKFAAPHNGLGNVLRDQGKAEEAIAEYRAAIALDPKFAAAHYNIGVLLRDRATPNISQGMRNAMLAEACQHFVRGAQIASTDRDYSAAMRSIEGRLAKGQHCPPR